MVARAQKDCFEKVLRGEGRVWSLLPSFLRQRRATCVQRRPASRRVRLPGSSEESDSDRVNHPWIHPAQRGTRIAHRRERFREGGWSDLHNRGNQEIHGRQVGGDQLASFLEQSSGAGMPVGLALHRGGDLQSREDKERRGSINSASSPSQTAARSWVRAHPPSGATKTSKCTGGPCVGKTWQNQDKKSKCREILGKCCPRRTDEGHDCRSASPQCLQTVWKAKSQEGCDGHYQRWCFLGPGSGPQSSCITAFSRVRFSLQMDTSRVGAAFLTQVQNSTQVLVQFSLSHQEHDPPSWQTLQADN